MKIYELIWLEDEVDHMALHGIGPEELVDFWDTHDLSDFEEQLEEVTEPLFERRTETILAPFDLKEVEAVKRIAKSQGIADAALIRGWVVETLQLAA